MLQFWSLRIPSLYHIILYQVHQTILYRYYKDPEIPLQPQGGKRPPRLFRGSCESWGEATEGRQAESEGLSAAALDQAPDANMAYSR